jgi:dipeptidyl-peptidase 4
VQQKLYLYLMKNIFCTILLLTFFLWNSFGQTNVSFEDCFTTYAYYPQGVGAFDYLKDGRHYVTIDNDGVLIHDILNIENDSLVALNPLASELKIDNYSFSKDERKLLLFTESDPVYRHSVLAKYYVQDLVSGTCEPLFDRGKQQFAIFSDDGNKVAFVVDNNLYIKDLSTKNTTQITFDGKHNEIINGIPDWVYEEEFSPVSGNGMIATTWSPDGTKLAFLSFDERAVPQMPLTWYEGGAYPRYTSFKYPKVGEANSDVSVHYYDLNTSKIVHPLIKNQTDDYLVRLNWSPDNSLMVTQLNRAQNQLNLKRIVPSKLAEYESSNWTTVESILTEKNETYLEIHDNLTFLDSGKQFVWSSEKSGFNHLYLQNTDDRTSKTLTSGNFDVTEYYGLDAKTGKYYYQTATPSPLDRQVWEGDLQGAAPRLLTPNTGTYDFTFSPSFEFYTQKWSDANTPPTYELKNRSGELIKTLMDNQALRNKRSKAKFVNKEFWNFKLENGISLNGWMLKPANLDVGKKYPVLFDNYGGPGSQTVQNQYDGYMNTWHQLLVQKGIIIVSVDNRGTGARGETFKKSTQNQLGKYETEDQIAAARYLGTMPYIDKDRIGIWGWSFGGYLSTSCILKGNDVFKMAMAVAPVTNWKWYDSAYTERYMQTAKENAQGYEENSPVNYANLLRGGNYFIAHGIADDNVHFQQTTEMINALIKANKQFETYYYPNRNHGINGDNATQHLFKKMTDFLLKKL